MRARLERIRREPLQRAAFVVGVAVVASLVRRGLFWLVVQAPLPDSDHADLEFLDRTFPFLALGSSLVLALLAARWLERPPLRWLPRRVGLRRPPPAALLTVALAVVPIGVALSSYVEDSEPPWLLFALVLLASLAHAVLWTGFVFHQLHLRCRFGFLASLLATIAAGYVVPVLSSGLAAFPADLSDVGRLLIAEAIFAVLCWAYVRWNANVWIVALFRTGTNLARGFEGDDGGGWLAADGPLVLALALTVLVLGTRFFAPGLAPAPPRRVASAEQGE